VRPSAEGLASLVAEQRQPRSVLAGAAWPLRCQRTLDGGTLVARIPVQLSRQRGNQRILAADGSELTPPAKPQSDGC
jgi:hypothetical protein